MKSILKVLSAIVSFIEKLFRKLPVKFRWPAFVVLAFAAAWSFVHIDSASADKHHLNGFYLVTGIVCALLVIDIFIVAATEEKTIEKDESVSLRNYKK
jgi:hypothetical protein